ncbi:hypothetical protein PF008_g18613 [Phytophthora fragariae]|uniref:Uncharacterized protein n=1 Tax=Phytophthora fragariae TaxID=53985 RepID=A0A6G0R527_9STRA|nr:hypothetical protein PF008_g18613 [Phytophthora fragariae]
MAVDLLRYIRPKQADHSVQDRPKWPSFAGVQIADPPRAPAATTRRRGRIERSDRRRACCHARCPCKF